MHYFIFSVGKQHAVILAGQELWRRTEKVNCCSYWSIVDSVHLFGIICSSSVILCGNTRALYWAPVTIFSCYYVLYLQMLSESTLVLSITISRMTAKKQKLFDFFSNPVDVENFTDVYEDEKIETDVLGEEFAVTVCTSTFVFHKQCTNVFHSFSQSSFPDALQILDIHE